mgnify:CR=1 FL=1
MIHIFKLINKGVKMKKVLSILAIIFGSLAILSGVVPMLIGIILGICFGAFLIQNLDRARICATIKPNRGTGREHTVLHKRCK